MEIQNNQLIIENEKSNDELVFSYGFDCGVTDFNPIDLENGVLRMHSARVQLDTDGVVCSAPISDSSNSIELSVKYCIEQGIIDVEKLKLAYMDAVIAKNTPVEVVDE